MKAQQVISWVLRIVAAFIMMQTLYFKFTAQPESIYIFSKLGMEPVGRIGTGLIELVASIMLLVPRTTWMGAVLGLGTMSGALLFHLTTLGIEVNGDGGQLFIYAITTFVCCLALLILERQRVRDFFNQSVQDDASKDLVDHYNFDRVFFNDKSAK
jgi:uncharacterized membrane protein YphA (DoxX/SURF4 family)